MALATAAQAQVPNAGFENWNGNVPASWSANNIAPLNFYVITPSTDAHTGTMAARGEVLQNPIITSQVVSPTMQTLGGAPVSQDPPAVMGWFKFGPTQGSTSFVIGATVVDINGQVTGIGSAEYVDAEAEYTQFSVPIDYNIGPSDPAASVTISFIIADDVPAGAVGSWFLVDDIALDGAQGIRDLSAVATVGAPYPTPFATRTTVPVRLAAPAQVRAEVLDVLGRPVQRLLNERLAAGEHLIEWTPRAEMANGIYFIRLADASGSTAKRVVLQR
jgi:hypothetical protein